MCIATHVRDVLMSWKTSILARAMQNIRKSGRDAILHVSGVKMYNAICIASRGRNPDNPSDRKSRGPGILQQRLEPNLTGICNCITSVSKDSLVLEIRHETSCCFTSDTKRLYRM